MVNSPALVHQDLKRAQDVIDADLAYVCENLGEELAALSAKHVLITGGAGFLGYYLIQTLLHWNRGATTRPIRITVYDNFVRGTPDWLLRCQADTTLLVAKHDVTDPLPSNVGQVDYIVHAASIASPTYYRRFPIETMDANVNGLRILLDYSRQQRELGKPISGFLFFSTSEIYGDPDPDSIPTPETYRGNVSCTGPRACYDESKRYGETLCVNFSRRYQLPVRIVRPFNNYGPGLKVTDRRVIPDLARAVLEDQDIVLLSDGSPTRTFCYVTDAIIGYYKVLVKGRDAEAYNIGTESPEISIGDLAERITKLASRLFGYKGGIVQKLSSDAAYLVDNPNRRCPAIGKAKTELGYNPSISLDDGLSRSLLWYRENRSAEDR